VAVSAFRLTLEYHGRRYYGWAAQPGLRTVEGELSRALVKVLGEETALTVAGRTDAGVHAWGQVAGVRSRRRQPDPGRLMAGINALTPADLAVTAVQGVSEDFDARHDARSRTYCYRILARRSPSPFEEGRSLWWPRTLHEESLHECARALVGTHDFTAFTPAQTEHVRFERDVMRAQWQRTGEVLEFWIEADTFMRHMVRTLVGTMLDVAAGRSTPGRFARLLDGAPRSAAGPTAEPHGLYLASVRY
jgi:tRNA pseudouridine38-40 synthase